MLGPPHTGNFYFESQANFRRAKFREILYHQIEHVLYCEIEFRK